MKKKNKMYQDKKIAKVVATEILNRLLDVIYCGDDTGQQSRLHLVDNKIREYVEKYKVKI